MSSINIFGGYNQQPVRQNPDEYAKQYAEQNGLSVEEAKAELKSKYGDPQQQNISSFGSFGNFNMSNQNTTNLETQIASLRDEIAALEELLFNKETTTTNKTTDSDKTETTTKDTTKTETETTKTENDSETTSTNRIKEYKDKTLYKYLRNEVGLSDSEIAKLSEDDEKKYKKGLHNRIGQMTLKRYYASLDE